VKDKNVKRQVLAKRAQADFETWMSAHGLAGDAGTREVDG
jgi:hypothetical protein